MREHATQLGGEGTRPTPCKAISSPALLTRAKEKIIHRRIGFRSEQSMGGGGGGDQTELFQWQGAQLYLIDGDDRALMQTGAFTLFLAQHSRSPQLVAVEATVGDVQWPVGKDCVVTCFKSRFNFALPGLVYELVLDVQNALGGAEAQMDRLETLLRLYTTFHLGGAAGSKGGSMKDLEEEAAERCWTSMAGRAEESDQAAVAEELEEAGEEKDALQLTLAGHRGGTCPVGVSRRMMKRMQQARRVSAVAKLFSKALVRGAIRAASHVDVAAAGGGGGAGAEVAPAVAKVEAVARVVEAVERKSTSSEVENPGNIVGISDSGCWTLNGPGLQLLLKAVIAANIAAAAAASSSSSSSASYLSPLASTSQPPSPHHHLLCDSSIMPPTSPHVASHPKSLKW